MCDIKNYHTEEHSLSNGQVLMRNYKYEEAVVIAKEMADVLALDLLEKGLVASSITLWIAYDHRYGQEPSKATERFLDPTNSSKSIIGAVEKCIGRSQILIRESGVWKFLQIRFFRKAICSMICFPLPFPGKRKKFAESSIGSKEAVRKECNHARRKLTGLFNLSGKEQSNWRT